MKRLALREYLPWTGVLLSWIAVAFFLGVENASYLAAAIFLLQSARMLTLGRIGRLLQFEHEDADRSHGRLLAYKVAIAGLVACAVLVGAMTLALELVGRWPVTEMLPLIAIGLPVRYVLPFTGQDRHRIAKFRNALAFFGLLLLIVAFALRSGIQGAALAFGLREWLALIFVLITQRAPARPRAGGKALPADAPREPGSAWDSFLQTSYDRSRRRLATRALKSLLGTMLGPLAGIITRTSRGVGLDRRLSKFVPQNARWLSFTSVSLALAGASTILLGNGPWTAVVGATLFRLGSAAGVPVLWSGLRRQGHRKSRSPGE